MKPEETIDWKRVIHLFKLGIVASLLVLTGDILLGWGVGDPSVTELPVVYSRYLSVSDSRIYASALLGLVGIPMECLCWFAIYRLIQPYSPKDAHDLRAGIIGCLAFGGCGVHVPCCMAVWLLKRVYISNPESIVQEMGPWLLWFLLPATIIFIVFFFLMAIVQIKAFRNGHTPLPRYAWIFSVLFGIVIMIVMRLIGDYPITNALSTGWISIGNLWMMSGLLVLSRKKAAACSGTM